jgi:hypothetical protein
MKNISFYSLFLGFVILISCGNTRKFFSTKIKNQAKQNVLEKITQDEAAKGIKEALVNGVGVGVDFLSKKDGFFKNLAYKILLPPEAQKVEKKLREIGLGAECDRVIENINRGAEAAVAEAKPIFVNAITSMTLNDAIGIVTGGNGAGTAYLKRTTTDPLKVKFKPVIQVALDKASATKYWKDMVTKYNKIPLVKKVNPDLNEHVTTKALEALFSQVEIEENKIRLDPLKRGTDILKKVFDYADKFKK